MAGYTDARVVTGTTSAVVGATTTLGELSVAQGTQWRIRRIWAAGSDNAIVKLRINTYPQAHFEYIFNAEYDGVIAGNNNWGPAYNVNIPVNGSALVSIDVVDNKAGGANDCQVMIEYESSGGPTN